MSSFKMVPEVATEEMRDAALAAYDGAMDGGEYPTYPDSKIAAAMIAAAIAKAPPFVVTDELVEKAAMAVERMVTADGYGWTDEQFDAWWNSDPLFCEQVNSWAGFTGTRKQKRIRETRAAIEAVLGGGG